MKAILVLFDSLNRHFLPPYGNEWIIAPNFERLAQRTVTFDNCYISSMPCMPARRELHTGRYNFLHRSWGPLEPFDDSMPELLKKAGVYSHLVSDHQHYWEDGGATYHNRYSSWEFVRGQEGDPWKGQVQDPAIPPSLGGRSGEKWRQDWVNRNHIRREAEMPQVRTFDLGLEFIETNAAADKWFLQIETFDPHEPFFSQKEHQDLYPHDYLGPHFDWPPYEPVSQTSEQVEHMRLEYAALLSLCDKQLGRVLDAMDRQNLWKDTLLIVTTDHGFMLGEHDWWAKGMHPCYNEIARKPLFVWDPRVGARGERRTGLTQMIDVPPTLLEYFGVAIPKDMQGRVLMTAVARDEAIHSAGLFGEHGKFISCTDGRYVYMRSPLANTQPLYEYTLMPTHMREMFSVQDFDNAELAPPFSFTKGARVMKIPAAPRELRDPRNIGTVLFDLEIDPRQAHPIQDPGIEQMMIEHLVHLMRANDAPPEQYQRLGLLESGKDLDPAIRIK
jgi:arylsulfatase A-like enzyme